MPEAMSPDPITTLAGALAEWPERERVGMAETRSALAALDQVRTLVEACLNAQEGYELGSDPDVYAALQPFTSGDTESG